MTTWLAGKGSAPEPPRQLFKYLERRWAYALLEHGAIRIGTLHEFRHVEEHGEEIGDREEGIVTASSDDPIVDPQKPETVSPVALRVLRALGIPVGAKAPPYLFWGIEFQSKTDSPDCWIYCTSRNFNESAMRRMNRDACVIIRRPEEFFLAITEKLKSQGLATGLLFGPCLYTERTQHYTKMPGAHPAQFKDPKHAYQDEARAIWLPRSLPIAHLDITCPEAAAVCCLYT